MSEDPVQALDDFFIRHIDTWNAATERINWLNDQIPMITRQYCIALRKLAARWRDVTPGAMEQMIAGSRHDVGRPTAEEIRLAAAEAAGFRLGLQRCAGELEVCADRLELVNYDEAKAAEADQRQGDEG